MNQQQNNNEMTQKDREKIETKLKNFKHIKAKIKGKLAEVVKDEDFKLQGKDYTGVYTGQSHEFYSEIEDYLLEKEESPNKLLDWVAERNKIQAAVDSLTHRERLVVKYYYFENFTALETGIRIAERDEKIYKKYDYEKKHKEVKYLRKKVERMKSRIIEKLYDIGLAELDGSVEWGKVEEESKKMDK